MRRVVIGLAALLLAGASTAATGETAPTGAESAATRHLTLASGATVAAPPFWTERRTAASIVLTAPEANADIALVKVEAKDAAAAADKAWAIFRPGLAPRPKIVSPLPPRNGWEERQALSYDTPPNEHAHRQAIALRKGNAWTVVLIDGSAATFEKRGAASALVVQTLRAPGFVRESYAKLTPHALDAARIEALKSFVLASMKALDVPGVGFALIDGGKIVYEGGLGVRSVADQTPVDAHTLFMIASNTKGMSTLLLAKAVDQGKLAWDEPVVKAYPSFRLGDAEVTRKIEIKNLVCACTGLPRKDLEWMFNTRLDTPASSTFDRLALTAPTSKFGEVFQYNNLMAAAAGYIAGHAFYPDLELGAAYDKAMQTEIFGPLGMTDTTFDYAKALAGDHALPYGQDLDGKVAPVNLDFEYTGLPSRPAGAAWSSSHDVARYVQNELTEGVLPSGRRLVSRQNLLERRKPNVSLGEDISYGMGLMTDASLGVVVVHHGGSMPGFMSDWLALPKGRIGAVLLTNSESGARLLAPFMRRLIEVVYDAPPQAEADVAASAAAIKAATAAMRKDLVDPVPADVAATLAAHYTNPDLGHITVRKSPSGALLFDTGLWTAKMASKTNADGSTSFVTADPGITGLELTVARQDGVTGLIIRDGQHAYFYTPGS
jgi:CubicO group peptidase (beta-lactamase class C family)